jgi:hypothetical protein
VLAFLYSPLVALVGLAVAFGVAWWSYRRTVPVLPPARRTLLAALRGLALALLTFLLAGPILRRLASQERPATVAIVVDASASMAVLDSLARGDVGRRIRAFAAADFGRAQVERFAFDRDVRPVATLETVRFDGARTDLARALERPAARLAGRNLQGLVLVTDGRATAGRSPLAVAARLGIPVFAVAVGDTATRRDVAVAGIVANRRVPPGQPQPVEVRVRYVGAAGQTVSVSLSVDGRVVGTQAVTLPGGTGELSVPFEYTPTAGAHTLTATVTGARGEATMRNNSRSLSVGAEASRRRVLLLGAAPDPDVSALRKALEADASLDLTVRVQKAPGTFYEGPLPDLIGFDVAVLQGYPGRAGDAALLRRIAEAPRLGLVVVAGSQSDYGMLDATLGGLLPVGGAGGRETPVRMAPGAAAHPALLGVPALDALPTLPPLRLSGPARVEGGGRVLLTGADGAPAVVAERRGRRRTVVVLGHGLWRWRTLPPALEPLGVVLPALVSRMVAFAASDAAPDVQVQAADEAFAQGEPVTFEGQVVDDEGEGVADALVEVRLSGPAARTLALRALGAGRYVLDAGALPSGTYRYEARATRGGTVLGLDGGTFRVGTTGVEFEQVGADRALLQAIATETGGRLVGLDSLDALRAQIAASEAFAPALVTREAETPLYDRWPFFVLIVLLLGTEWWLRRRSGLA